MGANRSRRRSASFDATGSTGAMIWMLSEVLVATVGLGRVNDIGINEDRSLAKTFSSRASREACALQPARPCAKPVRD